MPSSFEQHVDAAYTVLTQGGVVLLPTDVGYGLVGMSESAVSRIYQLKGRPSTKPCVTVTTAEILHDVADLPEARLREWMLRLAATVPVAFIQRLRPGSWLLSKTPANVLEQATHAGTIATFLNAGALVTALAERAYLEGKLVVGSSANVSGTGNNYALDEVPASIRLGVDWVIDGGTARYQNRARLATTVLDLTRGKFLRKGIHFDTIAASWDAFQQSRAHDATSAAV
jgi:tRNA A37 threonylcarbamoyladenosine synthetase subunit TsaC/SUA5/YrdC